MGVMCIMYTYYPSPHAVKRLTECDIKKSLKKKRSSMFIYIHDPHQSEYVYSIFVCFSSNVHLYNMTGIVCLPVASCVLWRRVSYWNCEISTYTSKHDPQNLPVEIWKKWLKYIYERTEAIAKEKKRNWDERQFSSLLIYNILVSGLAHLKDILYILQLENTIFLKGIVGHEYIVQIWAIIFPFWLTIGGRIAHFYRVFIIQKTFGNVFKRSF